MQADLWKKIEELYEAALAQPAEQRVAFLDQACAGDVLVRGEVQSLLDQQADSFLESAPLSGIKALGADARLKPLFEQALGLPPEERAAFLEKVRLQDEELGRNLTELAALDAETRTLDIPRDSRRSASAETRFFKEGELVLDRFRIVRFLGRGGMGEVYEADDLQLGKVALKTIRPEMAASPRNLLRFKREVQLARRVTDTTHVCRIHDLFTIPASEHRPSASFLTMEFLPGMTLAQRIEREGPLPVPEAESVALQLCSALQAIHDSGILHRDFKSGNVMLVPRNGETQAIVMDMGLAREAEAEGNGEAGLTMTGAVMGTPQYMAPEQFRGQTVGPATDIYALGVVLYEMVTGRRPFHASTPLAAAVMRGKRPSKASSIRPGLPPRWDEVINRCLEFEPETRWASARQVAEALAGGRGSWGFLRRLRGSSLTARPGRLPSRRALLYWGSGVVAAGAVTAWFWPDLEMWAHPLPVRRFVVAMMWPKLTDPQSISIASQLLATISRELARAEAYDKEFLILESGTPGSNFAAGTPAEAAGVLGANLVLAASVLPVSRGLEIALSVLDPANPANPLRQVTVSGAASTLPQRAAETAARLLGVRLGPDAAKAGDDFSNVRPAAYQLFLDAQGQMSLPNNAGLDAAIEKYQGALQEDPRFAAAYAGLAIAHGRRYAFRRNDSDLAVASRNSRLALEYAPASSSAQLSQALLKLYSGDTEGAVRMFVELLKADPGNEDVLMYEAQAFRKMNKTDLEEQVYHNLVDQRPNYWPAYNDLGLIYRKKGAYQEAVKYFLQATAIAPRAAIPWTNLGAAYFLLGKTDDARAASQRAIANYPNEDALDLLGDIAYTARDYRGALDYYQRARGINPNRHEIWRDIGDCYTMLGQPEQTQQSYQKAAGILGADLQINPRFGSDWMTLAYYSAKLGDRSTSMTQLAEAEKRGAADLESQLLKAQILVLAGEKEKGIRLTLDLLSRGMSPVYVNLSADLQGVLGDPRLRAALAKAR
jgi:serine/threonine protein kinase/tetratricopeptide (TPR) repeat protein